MIGAGSHDKTWWDGYIGLGHLAQVCSFTTDYGNIIPSDLIKPQNGLKTLLHNDKISFPKSEIGFSIIPQYLQDAVKISVYLVDSFANEGLKLMMLDEKQEGFDMLEMTIESIRVGLMNPKLTLHNSQYVVMLKENALKLMFKYLELKD